MTESLTRIIVTEKRGRTGRCWVTKSKSVLRPKFGPEVSYKPRLWFSAQEDNLTPSQADNILTRGWGEPEYEEIIYIIISLRDGERQRFAGDNELYDAMRAATGEAMQELARCVEARELVWVACVHSDYPRPCVKVLINRDIGKGRSKMLRSFPRKMRTHWIKQERPGEPRVTARGGCGDAFLRVLDEAASKNLDTENERR